jgi:integrase/recombinase XerD
MDGINVSLWLDTRRAKNSGLYPLKLRVASGSTATEWEYFPLKMDLSKEHFERSYLSPKPRAEYKELKRELEAILSRANAVIKEMRVFTLEDFRRRFFSPKTATTAINYHYQQYIDKLTREGRIKTADSYELSLGSLMKYRGTLKGKATELQFSEITPEFLTNYERWMKKEGRERTTVGFYLRALRAIFNLATAGGDIGSDAYPFGKGKYQIPTGKKVKKALGKDMLKVLFEFPTQVPQQIQARDYWFFSYCCNGMNVRDIAELKNSNLQGDFLRFYRTKTINTTKSDPKLIQVPLNAFAKDFIAKYRTAGGGGLAESYLFPILSAGLSDRDRVTKVDNFTRFLNQHIKNLAEAAGIEEEISTNWGRHSFTTNAIRNGASMEYIQGALGHNSINTTNNYFAGFEDNIQKHVSDNLMNF